MTMLDAPGADFGFFDDDPEPILIGRASAGPEEEEPVYVELIAGVRGGSADRRWQRVDLADPKHAKATEAPTILGLVYLLLRHALSGLPESAKTLIALIAGLETIRGGLGTFALIDFEQGEATTRRLLTDLGATIEEIAAVYYVAPDKPPDTADIDALAAAGVVLVVIDAAPGAYDSSGLDDHKSSEVERFNRTWIQPFWERGIAVVLIDHVVKNAEQRGRFASGSQRKLGAVDVHLGVEVVKPLHRGSSGLLRIIVHKDRPGHLARPRAAEITLHSDPETHRITWDVRPAADHDAEDEAERSDLPPAALKLLEALAASDEPSTSSELVDRIVKQHGHGLKRETVSRHLNALAKDGAVVCTNPDAAVMTPKLWQLAPGVTSVTSHVTAHEDDSRVTDVTFPIGGHVTRSHSERPSDEVIF